MSRNHLKGIPQFPLPKGFRLRLFNKGDELQWANVETKVKEFADEQAALIRFEEEFGGHSDEMTKRCLFIEDQFGDVIATTTAWYGKVVGEKEVLGRIHWVGVVPEYQGLKLSKPLLSAALTILAEHHTKAYLTTQTTSYQAVNMYLNYGFRPLLMHSTCEEAWMLMEEQLERKIL